MKKLIKSKNKIPYAKQHIDNKDKISVLKVLNSGVISNGKGVNYFENKAQFVNSQLSPKLTEKLKEKIIGTTRLKQTNNEDADYDISGYISLNLLNNKLVCLEIKCAFKSSVIFLGSLFVFATLKLAHNGQEDKLSISISISSRYCHNKLE